MVGARHPQVAPYRPDPRRAPGPGESGLAPRTRARRPRAQLESSPLRPLRVRFGAGRESATDRRPRGSESGIRDRSGGPDPARAQQQTLSGRGSTGMLPGPDGPGTCGPGAEPPPSFRSRPPGAGGSVRVTGMSESLAPAGPPGRPGPRLSARIRVGRGSESESGRKPRKSDRGKRGRAARRLMQPAALTEDPGRAAARRAAGRARAATARTAITRS